MQSRLREDRGIGTTHREGNENAKQTGRRSGRLSAFVTFDVSRAATPGASDVSELLKPNPSPSFLNHVSHALALLRAVDEAQ